MTRETSPYPEARPAATSETGGWSGSDLLIGGALVVLLIALFLPWFSTRGIADADGPTSHGYLWAVFVLAILALAVLVARDAIDRLPGNLPSPEQMLVGATGLALLLIILALVQEPGYSIGWSYGGFVALIAALIAFIAALGISGRLQSARHAAEARFHRPGTST